MSRLFPQEEIEQILQNHHVMAPDPELDKVTLARVKGFEVRDTDVFLLGFPKSGTTWSQEMVWLILNDLDFEGAKVYIDERFPNLEVCRFDWSGANPNMTVPLCHSDSITFATNMKNPRTIKSHLTMEDLPDQLLNGSTKAKIIYVARNPKDVCLSYFHHSKDLYKFFTGSLEDYSKLFMSDSIGEKSYWSNVLPFWKLRNEGHILFVKYEEMKNNLADVIKKVSKFLGKSITKEQEGQLIKWLDFDSMKVNSAVNHETLYGQRGFIRVGKIGEHKKQMSPEILSKFDTWINESVKDSDYEV